MNADSQLSQGRPRQTISCGKSVFTCLGQLYFHSYTFSFVINITNPLLPHTFALHLSVYFTTNCGDKNFYYFKWHVLVCQYSIYILILMSKAQKTMTNMTFCKKHLSAYNYIHDNNFQRSHFMALICRLCQSQFILFRNGNSQLSSFLTSSP